jgi:hypothetical protein
MTMGGNESGKGGFGVYEGPDVIFESRDYLFLANTMRRGLRGRGRRFIRLRKGGCGGEREVMRYVI